MQDDELQPIQSIKITTSYHNFDDNLVRGVEVLKTPDLKMKQRIANEVSSNHDKEINGKVYERPYIMVGGIPLLYNDEVGIMIFAGSRSSGIEDSLRNTLHIAQYRLSVLPDPNVRTGHQIIEKFIFYTNGNLLDIGPNIGQNILLSPFDCRSKTWNFFADLKDMRDMENLASSLIPNIPDASVSDKAIASAARRLFIAILLFNISAAKKFPTMEQFSNFINEQMKSPDFLYKYLASNKNIPEVLYSCLKDATTGNFALSLLMDKLSIFADAAYSSGEEFHLKEWIDQSGNKGALYLCNPDNTIVSRNTYFSFLLDHIMSLLSQKRENQHIWLATENIPDLGYLPHFVNFSSLSRENEITFAMLLNEPYKLIDIYGESVRCLIGDSHSVCLGRLSSMRDCELFVQEIGKREIIKRDTMADITDFVFLPSEIAALPRHKFLIKIGLKWIQTDDKFQRYMRLQTGRYLSIPKWLPCKQSAEDIDNEDIEDLIKKIEQTELLYSDYITSEWFTNEICGKSLHEHLFFLFMKLDTCRVLCKKEYLKFWLYGENFQ